MCTAWRSGGAAAPRCRSQLRPGAGAEGGQRRRRGRCRRQRCCGALPCPRLSTRNKHGASPPPPARQAARAAGAG